LYKSLSAIGPMFSVVTLLDGVQEKALQDFQVTSQKLRIRRTDSLSECLSGFLSKPLEDIY
jgi:hypothetical protein